MQVDQDEELPPPPTTPEEAAAIEQEWLFGVLAAGIGLLM